MSNKQTEESGPIGLFKELAFSFNCTNTSAKSIKFDIIVFEAFVDGVGIFICKIQFHSQVPETSQKFDTVEHGVSFKLNATSDPLIHSLLSFHSFH